MEMAHPLLISKGNKPRKGKIFQCKRCGKDLYRSLGHCHRKNYFCSKECNTLFLKENAFNFSCVICGKVVFTQPAQMKYRHRVTCSRQCRIKWIHLKAIERRQKEGYTKHQLDRLARYSTEAKEWRKKVFERDDYTCQFCGVKGTALKADHIKPFAYFPELRYDLSNGRTLCRPCHDKTKIGSKVLRQMYAKEKVPA